jgi:hypothetical protein
MILRQETMLPINLSLNIIRKPLNSQCNEVDAILSKVSKNQMCTRSILLQYFTCFTGFLLFQLAKIGVCPFKEIKVLTLGVAINKIVLLTKRGAFVCVP